MDEPQEDLTQQLNLLLKAGPDQFENLYRLVARELRRTAAGYLQRGSPDHTLRPTILVHDALLRLFGKDLPAFTSRRHFFCTAARGMRRLLIDHARLRNAKKRRGDGEREQLTPLEEYPVRACGLGMDLFALDRALENLEALDPLQAQLFDLYYFSDLTREQVAAELDLSFSRVKDELAAGKTWLKGEVRRLLADDAFLDEVRRAEEEALRADRPPPGEGKPQ